MLGLKLNHGSKKGPRDVVRANIYAVSIFVCSRELIEYTQ